MVHDAECSDSNARGRANRVSRACDRCRIRKIKCNGKSQCNRCCSDDAICVYTKKRRPNDRAYSKEYVQLLEAQQVAMVKAIKELYRRNRSGERLPDLAHGCKESMLIHEILSSLNALPTNSEGFDLDTISQCGDMSSTSSVCDSSQPQLDHMQTFFSDTQLPNLSLSPAPSSKLSASPTLATAGEFEGLMNSFDSEQLQMTHDLHSNLALETIDYPYLLSRAPASMDHHSFVKMQDLDFVNPRHTSYGMPFHLTHAYTT